MRKICVYVLKSDTGKAPKIEKIGNKDVCILKGCKDNIEKSAEKGDWIIGIGGKRTGKCSGNKGKYDRKLIYAMKVNENIRKRPISTDFYYFGDKAIKILKKFPKFAPTKHRFRTKYFRESGYPKIISEFERFIRKRKKPKNANPCDKKDGKKCGKRK